MNKENTIVGQLQKNVVRHYGKQINNATDCINLASLLTEKFNTNISAQTLRRFFGLIKSTSGSGHFTLDLLSKFCGYKDFKHFSHSYSNTELELFFGNIENTNQNYWEKSEQLCKQIANSPGLLVTTHRRLMSFPMARKYFIENHPLRDMLGTVYSQYFSAYLKFSTSNEAKIFAYGFLFKSAFLLQNKELMELYIKKVRDTEITDDVYLIPAGLKYGVQLLYADFTGNEYLFRKYFAEMKKVRLQYIEASEKSVCSFEYTVLESLIFTNRTKEMKFLIENNTVQKDSDKDFIPAKRKKIHDEVWKILCATAYQKMDDQKNSDLYLSRVNLENLGIGWEKYYSMMYYFVQLKSTDQHERLNIISKIKILIDDTYFSYYEDLLSDYLNVSEKELVLVSKK
ncbi:hypothetical protein [Kaistella jeonii]|uniref:Uncharacterized protein n=1 Tax=Kaistella jeonii TaxID=266749 RepID=A0A0C1F9J8_9FLAO|nr:hypothetical protein [Kaistella jeonii]KIA88578.1 hypothetical protein OA86_11205 [Kaistella jeonii]SFC21457.1 hypothetical protein SAMN05421876_10995 [Kaistella jeonii]VEI96944.1 Uncharacterised protein [Kaistella jeonii]